ncbi:histidine kinase [Ktedonobacteria bacterium brp13]|nr:histidine kinase [Ktedonobacteria bacterium brp13]
MLRFLYSHSTHCLLLLWMLFVYFWQLPLLLFKTPLFLGNLLISTALFAGHIVLYWIGISQAKQRLQRLLILGGLMGSVILLSFYIRNADIILGLYLAVLIEALHLLGQSRIIAGIVIVCSVLFFMNLQLIHTGLGFGLNLVPPLFFVGGYVVVTAQQTHAHQHTQSLLRELEKAHLELQTAHAQLAAYALHVEELTREAERQRLARELHDTQAQGLVGLVLQLEAIGSHLIHQHYERASTLVTQATERARVTLTAVRQAIDDLRANEISPSDLPEAVQEEIDRFTTTTGIHCTVDLAALPMIPMPLCDYTLRAITEGLNNIARHAEAKHTWIGTTMQNEHVVIEVRDNGKGFDPPAATQLVGHYGLLGLRERTRLIEGRFDIVSSPGTGATLRFSLPMKQGASEN